jgi:hypothetical protein
MKILVFAPHAAIWIHAFPEAVVVEALAKAGHEIIYVACDRQFADYCVAMSASGVPFGAGEAERRAVCDRCRVHAGLIGERFRFPMTELGAWLRPDDEAAIQEVVAGAQRGDPSATQFSGLPVGRFALYQMLVRRKRMGLDFSDEEWSEYQVQLAATVRAALALERIFAEHRPDRAIVYNGLYSINRVCGEIAERSGAPAYFLHAGGNLAHRLQTLMVGREHTFRFYPELLREWPRWREQPVSAPTARLVTDHFVELLRGRSSFVYSAVKRGAPFSMREHFGIPPAARILVATLGSYDEEFAAEMVGARVHSAPPMFPMQADWIRALCDFVAVREDLFLVVRVHPREFPNRRERVQSEHGRLLQQALAGLPKNARVNWPEERISLYDLAEEADVFLNSWSSVGKEMSLLGRPVVTYSPQLLFYPPDLNYAAHSRNEYFSLIDRALADGWSAERIRAVYRWLGVEYGHGLIDIADAYSEHETRVPMLPARAWRKVRRALDPLYMQRRDCSRRPARLAAGAQVARLVEEARATPLDVANPGAATAAEEDRAIRGEIGRLLEHLYSNPSSRRGALHARLEEFSRAHLS